MKKTLAALAVLGAFAAGSAYAADVTVVSRHLSVNKFVKFLWTVFQTSDTMK